MREEYHNGPGGLSGNEDGGQMSAWFVFSAMGFYPVCPGTDEYVLGSSLFDRIQIQVPGYPILEITNHNRSETNLYIHKVNLNGQAYEKNYLEHDLFIQGGKLTFEYSGEANKEWGILPEARPYSLSVSQK